MHYLPPCGFLWFMYMRDKKCMLCINMCITYAQDTYSICEKTQYVCNMYVIFQTQHKHARAYISETDSTINKNMIRSFVHHSLVFYETHCLNTWYHQRFICSFSLLSILLLMWSTLHCIESHSCSCQTHLHCCENACVFSKIWLRYQNICMCVLKKWTHLHVLTLIISGVTVHVSSYVTTYVSHL